MLREVMKYVIANDIRQPFKQVFREMYLLSEGEQNAEEVLRFKGFNVNLKRAVAALKNRGWGVSEDIGLRKVYYRQNTVAAVFREFDYYYILNLSRVYGNIKNRREYKCPTINSLQIRKDECYEETVCCPSDDFGSGYRLYHFGFCR